MADTIFSSGTVIASSWLNDVNTVVNQLVYLDVLGGDPTGAAPSDTAMALAIAALGSVGGEIICSAGEYTFASTIDLHEKYAITIRGQGSSVTIHNNGTVFKYTGTGSMFINAQSSHNITLSGIRIVHSNSGFTGYLLDGSQSIANDTGNLQISQCHFGSYTGLLHTATGLNLDTVISSLIEHTTFDSLATAIDGQDPAGGSYSNVITIKNCTFYDTTTVPIRYCGESWQLLGNTFEPRVTNIAGAIITTALTPVKSLVFSGNWLGDVSAGNSTWLTLFGKGASITGNRFGGTSGGSAIGLNAFIGCTITGNTFVLFNTVFSFDTTGCTDFIEHSNVFDSCTSIYGTVGNQTSFASGTTGHTILPNGKLMNWGRSTVTTGTPLAATFSKAFSTANYAFVCTLYAPTSSNNTLYTSLIGTTDITLNVNGTAGSNVVHWHAYGDV